jgi:secreted Zn-dependent insulinase-like peptidase
MGLVVLGRQTLPELRTLVERSFEAIRDTNASRFEPSPDAYILRPQDLPARLDIVPLADTRKLIILFPVPSPKALFDVSPLHYIASLLENRSQGSLYALLQKKGWITSMDADGDTLNDKEGQFSVSMELTPQGIEHLPEVEAALYAYIDLIKREGVERWRYEEQQKLDELAFRFASKEPPFEYVSILSRRLLDYPPAELLRGGRILQRFDASVIHRYLDLLRPDNALTIVVDKQAKTDKVESNYQVAYALHKGAEKLADRQAFAQLLRLPGPNPFIPKKVDFVTEKELSAIPLLLERKKGFYLWHKHDISFGAPRTIVTIRLRSPIAADTAAHNASLKLYMRLVNERLAPLADAASRAGIHYSLSNESKGILLQVYGYSDTLPLFLDKLFEAMRDTTIDPQRFTIQKAQLDRDLANQKQRFAYEQVLDALVRSLVSPSWSPEAQRSALKTIDADALKAYLGDFYKKIDVTMLDIGNTDKMRSLQLAAKLKETLLAKSERVDLPDPVITIPKAGEPGYVEYPVEHPDSVLIEADLDEPANAMRSAKWQLLAQLIAQPFTADLRTRQQLGYVVASQFLDLHRYPMLLLVVQSSRVGAPELEKRFDAFRHSFLETLQKIDEKNLEAHKAGLIATLLRKDETLLQRSVRFWSAIVNKRLSFNFQQKVAEALRRVDKKTLTAFYEEVMLQHPRRAFGLSNGATF